MKKFWVVLVSCMMLFTGCSKKESMNSNSFKEEYEALNGTTNSNGKEYRTLNIDANNKFVEVKDEEVVEMMEKGESFYVYFGDPMCPWCRSVLEVAVDVSNEKNVDKVYYVDIWDENGDEVVRDKYALEDGKIVKKSDGSEAYAKLIELMSDVLSDYTLSDDHNNTYQVGEKRIYAPNFIKVENGKAVNMVEGISSLQESAYDELSQDMLDEEREIFSNFFE